MRAWLVGYRFRSARYRSCTALSTEGKPPSDEGGGFAEGEDGGRENKKQEGLQDPEGLPFIVF